MTNPPFSAPEDAAAFDPGTVRILSDAFQAAWQSLLATGTTFHNDAHVAQTREILARCIIEMAKLGERDLRRLCDAALAHLAEANIRRGRE
jgi:hypothetical protein